VQNIEQILPPPPPPPQPVPEDPAFENGKAAKGLPIQPFPEQDHDAHIATHTAFFALPIVQAAPQVQAELLAHMFSHISMKARNIVNQEIQQLEAQNMEIQVAVQQGRMDPMVAQQQIQQQAMAIDPTQTEARIAQLEAQFTAELMQQINPMGQNEDPLVQIRQQELAIRAAESDRKAQLDRERMELEEQKLIQRAATDAARIESQEEIADQRADVNMERINLQRQNMQRRQT
jgi:hypothetical protein